MGYVGQGGEGKGGKFNELLEIIEEDLGPKFHERKLSKYKTFKI